MSFLLKCIVLLLLFAACFPSSAQTQPTSQPLTWDEVKSRFEANNPMLQAGALGIQEAKASEVTAYLRPNPTFTAILDQVDPFTTDPWRPLSLAEVEGSVTYLHERRRKRELRRDSAEGATAIATSEQADLERTLLFNLRSAFIQTLQNKAIVQLAKTDLDYYDQVLEVNRERHRAGAISRVDLDRLELQRVQFQSDLQTASVNLRSAKIQLLALLNDRTPVDEFDVTGTFDFSTQLGALDDYRGAAVNTRPDLKAALQAMGKAKVDHQLAVANGSTDPTFGFDVGKQLPVEHYVGFTVSIPLRAFDRNQGEKLRTQLDVDRNAKLVDAQRAQVFSDVDSAYVAVESSLTLLRPYKEQYLKQASDVRDTIYFSYQKGAASLLDFLSAEKEYRDVQLAYLNLIGSYMIAAGQLNLAVGREVLQ